jgi:hypothetical protein
MIRTVSLWIRLNGKFSQPLYQDNKQNAPEAARRGILLALCGGMVSGWQRFPPSEALPHLNPHTEETRLTVAAAIKLTWMKSRRRSASVEFFLRKTFCERGGMFEYLRSPKPHPQSEWTTYEEKKVSPMIPRDVVRLLQFADVMKPICRNCSWAWSSETVKAHIWNGRTLIRGTNKSPACAKVTILRATSRLEWVCRRDLLRYEAATGEAYVKA